MVKIILVLFLVNLTASHRIHIESRPIPFAMQANGRTPHFSAVRGGQKIDIDINVNVDTGTDNEVTEKCIPHWEKCKLYDEDPTAPKCCEGSVCDIPGKPTSRGFRRKPPTLWGVCEPEMDYTSSEE